MLAALNVAAVAIGVAGGGLAASFLALVVSGVLTLIGVDSGSDIGLVTGVLAGLAVGGWVSGKRAVHSHRFHGMVTGLLLAFVIMVIARLGGSTAGTPTIIWLAVVSITVSGTFGWAAGRHSATDRTTGV